MPTDPQNDRPGQQDDATNQGVPATEPAEGADDAAPPTPDSPGQ